MSDPPVKEEAPPEQAFAALSDATRVDILRALWEDEADTVSFSELYEAVGIDDSGQFNYHLSKLRGRFLSSTDDGYRLREAGIRIVGALLSGRYTQTGSTESVAMDQPCPFCDGCLTFEYEDERVGIDCAGCGQRVMSALVSPGVFASHDQSPLPEVTGRYVQNLVRQFGAGFCTLCDGRVQSWMKIETPSPEDLSRIPIACYECERCGELSAVDLGTAFLDHPEVGAFYYDHDINVRETALWRFIAAGEDSARILSEEPLRAKVVYTADGDRLTLTVGEDLDILAIEHD